MYPGLATRCFSMFRCVTFVENQPAVRRQVDGRGVGAGGDAKLAVRQPDRARVDGGQAGDDEGIEPEAEAAGGRRGVLSGQPPDY